MPERVQLVDGLFELHRGAPRVGQNLSYSLAIRQRATRKLCNSRQCALVTHKVSLIESIERLSQQSCDAREAPHGVINVSGRRKLAGEEEGKLRSPQHVS